MTYRRILLAAMLVGLLPAAAAFAQASQPETTPPTSPTYSTPPAPATPPAASTSPATTTVSGKVLSETAEGVVIETDSGQHLSLSTDTATSMPAISPGDRVSVRYSTLASGSYHAEAITVSTTGVSNTAPVASSMAPASPAPSTVAARSLPKTASPLPLVLLIGSLAGLGLALLHSKQRNA